MEKRRIIIDCDPGHDDAVAILMAARHPKLELLGITTVRGNQTLEKTTRNALNVCQWLGVDVPVCKGMAVPMVREPYPPAEAIHGDSGLDGPVFPPLKKQLDPRHAIDFIIETVLASDRPVTLVPTGPLTNVAMAIRQEPKILDNIDEIVLMGGSYQLGNTTPVAEFNIAADAEAAYVVFTCGVPVVMMGLDLTRQALCYPSIVERMSKIDNKAAKLFCDLMGFFCKTQKEVYGWEGGPLHDPTCIAYLLDPDCIETKHVYTEIEIRSERCYGRTICDMFGKYGEEPNSHVATKLNVDRYWDLIEECIRLYD